MLSDDALLRIVGEIYETTISPERWTRCLTSIRDAFGGTGVNLLHHDHTAHTGGVNISVMPPRALELYAEYYHRFDPWALAMPMPISSGSVLCGAALVPRPLFTRTEFWTDFARDHGVSRAIVGVLDATPHRSAVFSVNRSDAHPEFDEHDARVIRLLMPHVQRALIVQRRLRGTKAAAATFVQAIDSAPAGIVVMDDRLQPVYVNRLASELMARRDGLTIDPSGLRAVTPTLTGQLRQMIGRASALRGQHVLDAPPVGLALPRPSGRPAFEVCASPIARRGPVDEGWPAAAVIVIIVDPDRAKPPAEEILRALFQLTPTEAGVASALAAGRDIEDIAASLRRTRETVRWHTKRILHKADCRSQAEFVRRATMGVRNGD